MKDSWLTPEGKIIEVGEMRHDAFAWDYLRKEMGSDLDSYLDTNNFIYPHQILHQRGWVRIKYNSDYLPKIQILGDCIDLCKPMKNTIDPAMNGLQMIVAKELCEKNGVTLRMAINDKRFW